MVSLIYTKKGSNKYFKKILTDVHYKDGFSSELPIQLIKNEVNFVKSVLIIFDAALTFISRKPVLNILFNTCILSLHYFLNCSL